MTHFAELNIPGIVSYATGSSLSLEGVRARARADFKATFEEHRHRVYSLAFWMTDNEITAEEISTRTFLRAFHSKSELNTETIDASFVRELRDLMPVGNLTLNEKVSAEKPITGNTKRVHLERAVVQIPVTERLAFLMHDVDGYDHVRIAKTLGISEAESRKAVFQARLRVRELVAKMI